MKKIRLTVSFLAILIITLLLTVCSVPQGSSSGGGGGGGSTPPVPVHKARGVTYTDTDKDPGEIKGDVTIIAASIESDVTRYTLYWSNDGSTRAGSPIHEFGADSGHNLTYRVEDNSAFLIYPYFLVFTKNANGEMSAGVSCKISDLLGDPPTNDAAGVSFADTDTDSVEIGGDISITKAGDESDVTHYVLYWGSDSTTKIGDPIAEIAKTGSDLTYTISDNTKFEGKTHFLVFSKNANGEKATGISCEINDISTDPPTHSAQLISFADTDTDTGQIGGTVTIIKAANETDITHYVLYWGTDATTKNGLITEIAKTGSNVTYPMPVDTIIGANTHLLVYTKNVNGEMSTGISYKISDLTGTGHEWTILIHFAIDNDIDYNFEVNHGIITNYLETLESIEANDTSNNLQILVMMDCYNDERFNDGYYALTGGSFEDDLVVDKTEINSGSVGATEDFMDWVVANYPGNKYMYSVFNHGSGFDDQNTDGIYGTYVNYGIGFDDSNDDCLSHYELGLTTAYLSDLIGQKIDIFYPYACLMGGVELAYEIKDNANYLLFSEESFPADYWSYEALANINLDRNITALNVAEGFCDSAYTYFTTTVSRDFTLSVIDLSTISALYSAINSFATPVIADIIDEEVAEDYLQLAYSSLSARIYIANYDGYYVPDYYYLDLGNYMSNINSSSFAAASVKTAAAAINTAIGNTVVYKRQNGYSIINHQPTGITIFHNIKNSFLGDYSTTTYKQILAFRSNSWVNYLEHLESTIDFSNADHYEDDDTYSTDNYLSYTAANNRPQYHTIHATDDVDWFSTSLSSSYDTLVGFLSDDDSIVFDIYPGDSSGPYTPSTPYDTITDSSEPFLLYGSVYLWVKVRSKNNKTGMYRASICRLSSAYVDELKKINKEFRKIDLK